MATDKRFVPLGDGNVCGRCGTLLGRIASGRGAPEGDPFCPSPVCNEGEHVAGVDSSYLYRARALIFRPSASRGLQDTSEEDRVEETGVILAVKPEHVHDDVSRRNSPIVATGVRWPADRRQFSELFDRHVHHESAPHITPLNDGWDARHSLPVL